MVNRNTCEVTPAAVGSAVPGRKALDKSIGVTIDGNGTVDVMCTIGEGWGQSDSTVGSTLTATGRVDTTALCDKLWIRCGGATPPAVSAWIRQLPDASR